MGLCWSDPVSNGYGLENGEVVSGRESPPIITAVIRYSE